MHKHREPHDYYLDHRIGIRIFIKNNMETVVKKKILEQELAKLPEQFWDDLIVYIKFLQFKSREEEAGIHYASEAVLAKDWNTAEEEEAWKHL